MEQTFSLTINHQKRTITTDPARPLLEVLREELQLTGTKRGCGEGQCGACTVLIDGRSMVSCITPIANAANHEVLTIESLAEGDKLHPVQEAFVSAGASQCGYCTPGMIMAVVGLLNDRPKPTMEDIHTRLEPHLCRCCNYPKIMDAVKIAAGQAQRAQ